MSSQLIRPIIVNFNHQSWCKVPYNYAIGTPYKCTCHEVPKMSCKTDERYTPPEVMKPLERLFFNSMGEMFDPCPANYFFDRLPSGLEIDWAPRKCFVNPPYSNIAEWAEKAAIEAHKGAFVAFLIPNDCSTVAFRRLRDISWGRWEIPFRVKFDTPEGDKKDVARSHVVFFLGVLR